MRSPAGPSTWRHRDQVAQRGGQLGHGHGEPAGDVAPALRCQRIESQPALGSLLLGHGGAEPDRGPSRDHQDDHCPEDQIDRSLSSPFDQRMLDLTLVEPFLEGERPKGL